MTIVDRYESVSRVVEPQLRGMFEELDRAKALADSQDIIVQDLTQQYNNTPRIFKKTRAKLLARLPREFEMKLVYRERVLDLEMRLVRRAVICTLGCIHNDATIDINLKENN